MLAGVHKVGAWAWCKGWVLSEKDECKNTTMQKPYHLPWRLQLFSPLEDFPGEKRTQLIQCEPLRSQLLLRRTSESFADGPDHVMSRENG